MQTCVLRSCTPWESVLHEGVCLVCGTLAPSTIDDHDNATAAEHLRGLGWHSWESHTASTATPEPRFAAPSLPRLPSGPMFVATNILKNHGALQMEAWITSMELSVEISNERSESAGLGGPSQSS